MPDMQNVFWDGFADELEKLGGAVKIPGGMAAFHELAELASKPGVVGRNPGGLLAAARRSLKSPGNLPARPGQLPLHEFSPERLANRQVQYVPQDVLDRLEGLRKVEVIG